MLTACGTGRPAQQPYSCGDASKNHCYAITIEGDHILGFKTKMLVASKFLPGDQFITNEFWLTNYQSTTSWIEVGYKADTTGLHYFWAKNDENGVFSKGDQIDIPPNEVGTSVAFAVYQLQPGVFEIVIDGTQTHFSRDISVRLWDGTTGGYVEIGQELAGTTGAAAGLAVFENNRELDRMTGWQWLDDEKAGVSADKPPYGE